MNYFYSHSSMPKFATMKDMSQHKNSDLTSHLSYTSEIMKKKQRIFGINPSTLNVPTAGFDPNEPSERVRSLTLATSTVGKSNASLQNSAFIGRESDKYKDLTKEKVVKAINDQKYHKRNDLSTLTYNSLTGRYY